MIIKDQSEITQAVLRGIEDASETRIKEIMSSFERQFICQDLFPRD